MRRSGSIGLYIRWLALPLTVLALALIFDLGSQRQQRAGTGTGETGTESLSDAYFLADAKLRRTYTNWGGNTGRIEPLGSDGLSIDLLIRNQQWADLRTKDLVEQFRDVSHETLLRFNGGQSIRGSYRVRGQSSLRSAFQRHVPERLNFHIRLGRALPFTPELNLKRFYLQNLMFDPYGYEMRIGYDLLESIGLFYCHNQLVDLRVNGRMLGIFLLVERPRDAILRNHRKVEGIYRRLSTEVLSFAEFYQRGHGAGKELLARLLRALEQLRGQALVEELEQIIDLDGYLRWLAFNSLVKNGDSFDEVFFYLADSPGEPRRRLRIMGWDYDDIMAKPAHPRVALKDALLYSSEGDLDRLIQAEPVLYRRFCRVYRQLLDDSMTPANISAVTGAVAGELDELDSGLDQAADADFRQRRAQAILDLEAALLARREQVISTLEQCR